MAKIMNFFIVGSINYDREVCSVVNRLTFIYIWNRCTSLAAQHSIMYWVNNRLQSCMWLLSMCVVGQFIQYSAISTWHYIASSHIPGNRPPHVRRDINKHVPIVHIINKLWFGVNKSVGNSIVLYTDYARVFAWATSFRGP